MDIRPTLDTDRPALANLATDVWGADIVIGHGVVFRPLDLPGFLAVDDGDIIGVLTYTQLDSHTAEVVTIDALRHDRGIGTALLDAVSTAAVDLDATQLGLTTTSDELELAKSLTGRP